MDAQSFSVKLALKDVSEPIQIANRFILEAELFFLKGFTFDKDEILDHLLRPQGLSLSEPFKLVELNEISLPAQDEKYVHEKIQFVLEPLLPGKYVLTLLQIPFVSEGHDTQKTVFVPSPIIPIEIAAPNSMPIDLAAEAAPLVGFSDREPIELSIETRKEFFQDISKSYEQAFDEKEVPVLPVGVMLLFLLIYLGVRSTLKASHF